VVVNTLQFQLEPEPRRQGPGQRCLAGSDRPGDCDYKHWRLQLSVK